MINMETKQEFWDAKQERKLERFQDLAQRNAEQSVSVRKHADAIADMIPFGQPILVGHHSEKRHRRDKERIFNGMGKSIELAEKSEHYKEKAERILNPTAISSDNPNAIPLLEEKLSKLNAQRENIKAFNKDARKNGTDPTPSYELANLSGNIATVKKRIEYLKSMEKIPASEEIINDITIVIDPIENRVKLLFPSIPSEEIRDKLKSNGFHWSSYNKAWQRQISRWSIDLAKEIAGGLK